MTTHTSELSDEPPCGPECVGCQIDEAEGADKRMIARLSTKLERARSENTQLRSEAERWVKRVKKLEMHLDCIRSLLP